MTKSEFISKWHSIFADNGTGEITSSDFRAFVSDLAQFFVAESKPPVPDGVSWILPPIITIVGDQVSTSDSELQIGEDLIAIPSATVTVDYAGAALKRKDVFGIYYEQQPPVYGTLNGTEVTLSSIAFSPVIPDGFFPLSYLDVTDGNITQLPTFSEKFKGKWVEGIIEADTYWLTATGIWRAKRKHGSSVAPTVADANWELVFAGGISDSADIPYGPADNNNASGFFAGLLTSGKLMVNVALNAIVARIGVLSALNTTIKTNLVAAINELRSGGTKETTCTTFNTTGLKMVATSGHYGRYSFTRTLPAEISSLAYETRVAGELTWTLRADLAAVNAWNFSTVGTTTAWELKEIATPNPSFPQGIYNVAGTKTPL